MIPSADVQRIAGTYIEDSSDPQPPLLAWIQIECRTGCFKEALEKWARDQSEPLRPDLTLVERAESEKIALRMPSMVLDHESTSRFSFEVPCALNPMTHAVTRL